MKYNNIFKYSALSLAAIAMWGCTKDVDYDPASAMTNAQVYFASNAASSFDLNEDQNSVTVDVSRVNTTGALTIDVTASAVVANGDKYDETDIFTVPATATFAEGAESAPITITFDFNEIKPETDYIVTLDIAGESLTPYGKSQQEVTIKYAPWSAWEKMAGEAIFTSGLYGEPYTNPIEERHSLLNKDLVQYNIPEFFVKEGSTIVNLNLSNNMVTVPVQGTGVQGNWDASTKVEIKMCDTYTFYTEVAKGNPEDYKDKSYFNPETGLMTINVVYFAINGNQIGRFSDITNIDYLQLPGYPDYNIVMSNAGTYISEAGQEFTILNVVKGSDVASYAITLVPEELNETAIQEEVDAIVANTETVLYNENREFKFPVSNEGYYTCIAVAYGADGEPAGHSSYIFYNEINGVDWNEGWTTVTKSAVFYDVFFAGLLYNKPYDWEVEVQQSDATPGVYRIVKPYANNIYDEPVERGHYYVMIDARDPNAVSVLPSVTSLGYAVLSAAPGKLVDGKRFVFPGSSLGVFRGYNDDGSYKVLSGWKEEATLLDLDSQPETEPAPATRSSVKMNKKVNLSKSPLIPYNGKKIAKKPLTVIAK